MQLDERMQRIQIWDFPFPAKNVFATRISTFICDASGHKDILSRTLLESHHELVIAMAQKIFERMSCRFSEVFLTRPAH